MSCSSYFGGKILAGLERNTPRNLDYIGSQSLYQEWINLLSRESIDRTSYQCSGITMTFKMNCQQCIRTKESFLVGRRAYFPKIIRDWSTDLFISPLVVAHDYKWVDQLRNWLTDTFYKSNLNFLYRLCTACDLTRCEWWKLSSEASKEKTFSHSTVPPCVNANTFQARKRKFGIEVDTGLYYPKPIQIGTRYLWMTRQSLFGCCFWPKSGGHEIVPRTWCRPFMSRSY